MIARYPLGGPVFHAESFLLDGQPLLLMLWGGVLHCLRLDGSIRWKSIPMGFEGVIGVDDLDNDGRLEVVLTNGRTIAVLAADSGALLWQEYLGPPYSAGVMPTGALIHHFPQLGTGKQLLDLFQKAVNSCGVRKEAVVEAVGIPTDKDVAQVKDNGCDILFHRCRAILSEEVKSGGIIARL